MICRSCTDFSQLLRAYQDAHDLKPSTVEQLRVTVRLFERWFAEVCGGPFELSMLGETIVGEFLHTLGSERGDGPTTRNSKRRMLICLWRFAHRKGLAPSVEPADIVRFREPTRLPVAWTLAEMRALLRGCTRYAPRRPVPGWDQRHDRALILLIYDTGLRVQAALALRTADLSSDGAVLARAETQKPCCDESKWLSEQTTDALAATFPPMRERLFPWPYGRRSLNARLRAIQRSAGLPASRRDLWQKQRRTSASWLERARPGAAQHHLGHKTPGMAARHYIDPRIAYDYKAADLMPRIA